MLQTVTDTQQDITTGCKLSLTHNRTQQEAENCHLHTTGHNNKLQTVTDTQQDIITSCKLSLTQNRI